MRRAPPEPARECRKRHATPPGRFEQPASPFSEQYMRVTRDCLPWLAATAGAEAFLFGRSRKSKEADLIPPGPARRAPGSAVDPRRPDRVHERAVKLAVALEHCLPALVVGEGAEVHHGHKVR